MPKNLIKKNLYFKADTPQAGDQENYIIRGVFSTGDEDRQGDVVVQNGWDISEFMLNPVVLAFHDHYQPAIGKIIELGVNVEGNLAGAIQFAAKEYEFAMTMYKLYAGLYMRAFSAGFENLSYEVDQENDRMILKENRLYEISCVNVPANAMALAMSKGIDVSSIQKIQSMGVKQELKDIKKSIDQMMLGKKIGKSELIDVLSKSDIETIQKVKRVCDRILTTKKEVGKDIITVKTFNKAIRSLLKAKKSISNK